MRRTLLILLGLICAAALAWRVGAGVWPGGSAEPSPSTEEAENAPTLQGNPAPETDEEPKPPPTPPPPPDWAYGTVTGRVVGPDGEPLPESGAAALGVQSLYGTASFYRDTPCDIDGRFALHVKANLASVIVAGAHHHGIAIGPRVRIEEGGTQDVGTLHLVPERRVVARVVDAAGARVEDVEVYLESETDPQPEGWQQVYEASGLLGPLSTGADGQVVFNGLPTGTWRVSIDTGATDSRDAVREHVHADGKAVVFALPATVSPTSVRVQVQVLGPDSEPVPQCRIRLQASESAQSMWWRAADPRPVELEGALGPIRMIVQEPCDADRVPLPYAPVTFPDVRGLENPIVVRMEPGDSISGRVVFSDEAGPWNVMAHGWLDTSRGVCEPSIENGGALVNFRAKTGAGGSFCIVGLPAGRFRLVAQGPGQLRGKGPVAEAGATDVLLEMGPVGTVEVHVLAPRGLHFGAASMRLDEWVGIGLEVRGRWNGGKGKRPDVRVFHTTDLQLDGRYRVRAWGQCSGVDCPPVALDDVVPREAPYVIQLEEPAPVHGVVEREDGTPVWGAHVHHRPWPGGAFDRFGLVEGRRPTFAASDATGAFALSGAQGEVVLGVIGLGLVLRDAPPTVLPGTGGVRLVVVPERRISGHVVDAAGGPLDGLRAIAIPAVGPPALWTPHPVSADGFFEIGGLAPGTWRVVIWNERDPTDLRSVISAPVPAGGSNVHLELTPGSALVGAVRDHQGRAVSGATVRLLGRWTNRTTQTDVEGHYAFAGVPTNVELELEVVTPLGRSILHQVTARRTGEPTPLDVTVPAR